MTASSPSNEYKVLNQLNLPEFFDPLLSNVSVPPKPTEGYEIRAENIVIRITIALRQTYYNVNKTLSIEFSSQSKLLKAGPSEYSDLKSD